MNNQVPYFSRASVEVVYRAAENWLAEHPEHPSAGLVKQALEDLSELALGVPA